MKRREMRRLAAALECPEDRLCIEAVTSIEAEAIKEVAALPRSKARLQRALQFLHFLAFGGWNLRFHCLIRLPAACSLGRGGAPWLHETCFGWWGDRG